MQSSRKDQTFNALKLVVNSGEKFEPQFADALPSMVLVYELQSNLIPYLNKKAYYLLGFDPEEFGGAADLTRNIIAVEDLLQLREAAQTHLHIDGNVTTLPIKLRTKNATSIEAIFSLYSYTAPGSNNSSVVLLESSSGNDAFETDEEESEKELLDVNEEILKSGTLTWLFRGDDVIWSNGLYQLMEYEKEEVAEQISIDFFFSKLSRDRQQEIKTLFEAAKVSRSEWQAEVELITGKGTKKMVSIKGKPISDGGGKLKKMVIVTRDITEEIEVQRNLTSYRQMMLDKERFLGSGSWESNLTNGELSWSEGKYRLFGYDPDVKETLPRPTFELYRKHISEEQLEKMQAEWMLLLDHLEEHTWEYELTTVQGEKKICETYGRQFRGRDGKSLKVIGASRDVTKIREYEKSLKHKIEELDRSNKELEEFAYIASHDLQEPLRKITAFSERLKDRSGNELGAEGNVYLDRMLVATQNMRLLIDNLLEFSRTSRRNQAFAEVDFNKTIKEVLSDLELKVEETDAIITYEHLPTISGITSQMRQLFTNLISNSIKFRKAGERPKITIRSEQLTRKEKEDLRLRAEKVYYKIKLKDEGIGFEREYALKIFQIFQRLHGKSEYPGSGIGLAICKKIAENHHGLIYADSEPGQGAEFLIILPETQD